MTQTEQNWENAKDFQKDNIIVRVTKLQGYRPRYSLQIGRANEDNKVMRHFGVFMDFANGNATLRKSIANDVALLIAEAEAWIEQKTQERESEILEERIYKDTQAANRDKPHTRHTGKTERDRNKRRQE